LVKFQRTAHGILDFLIFDYISLEVALLHLKINWFEVTHVALIIIVFFLIYNIVKTICILSKMLHNIPEFVKKRMNYLEKIEAEDRVDGTPRMEILRQIPPETGKLLYILDTGEFISTLRKFMQ
jgi:hypothetical protein